MKTLITNFNNKPANEKAAIIGSFLLAGLIIWMLCVGDASGLNNTYLG